MDARLQVGDKQMEGSCLTTIANLRLSLSGYPKWSKAVEKTISLWGEHVINEVNPVVGLVVGGSMG